MQPVKKKNNNININIKIVKRVFENILLPTYLYSYFKSKSLVIVQSSLTRTEFDDNWRIISSNPGLKYRLLFIHRIRDRLDNQNAIAMSTNCLFTQAARDFYSEWNRRQKLIRNNYPFHSKCAWLYPNFIDDV